MLMANPRRLVSEPDNGLFVELGVQARLLMRLLADRRVNSLLKILPIISFLYLLFPFDLLGPIDDAIVIWLGATLFIELSPQDVVDEHRAALSPARKNAADEEPKIDEGDIIDAKFRTKPKE